MAQQEESRSRNRPIMAVRQVRLSIVKGGGMGRVYLTGGDTIRIGKAMDNDVVLADDTVSRRHLRIQIRPRGFFVEDLGSTNGTVLDGSSVEKAYGRPGSLIAAGDVVLSVGSVFVEPDLLVERLVVPEGLVAEDEVTKEGIAAVELAAGIASPVAIMGEEGTGRRTMAKLLVQRAGPGAESIVMIDAMRPEQEVIASVEAGLAQGGGTVVLVEPWALSAPSQLRLLRMLDEYWGDHSEGKWARVVAVSSRELSQEVLRGSMDRRLADYLTRIIIRLAPLRERPKDTLALTRRFIEGGRDAGIAQAGSGSWNKAVHESGEELEGDPHGQAHWLGLLVRRLYLARNVVDLNNVVQSLSQVGLLTEDFWAAHMPGRLERGTTFSQWKQRWQEESQRRYLRWILAEADGNLSKAARMADMDRKHLGRLVARHGLRGWRTRGKGGIV